MIIGLSFVTLHVVYVYIYNNGHKPPTFAQNTKTNYYTLNFFIMNKQNYFDAEYVAPEVEVISMSVERGFELSYGREGYAGQDGDVFDYDGEEL